MPRRKKETLKKRKDGRYKCKYHGVQFYGETPEAAFAARDEYIRDQEKDDIAKDKLSVKEYEDPFGEDKEVRKPNQNKK